MNFFYYFHLNDNEKKKNYEAMLHFIDSYIKSTELNIEYDYEDRKSCG